MANLELTSYQWDKILAFLRSRSDLYVGRESHCLRFITAVLWIARSGATRGIWAALHQHLADDPDTEYLIIDSTIVRAHPDAAGAPKKGAVKTLKR